MVGGAVGKLTHQHDLVGSVVVKAGYFLGGVVGGMPAARLDFELGVA